MDLLCVDYNPQVSTTKPVMTHSRSSSISSSPSPSSYPVSTSSDHNTHHKSQTTLSKMWAKVDLIFSYGWLFIQLILLVAALTVLHFSTFMVTLSYVIYGYFKRNEFKRQEFLQVQFE